MPKFACVAYLTKTTPTGFSYRLVQRLWEAPDRQTARGMFGIAVKDELPDFGLDEVLALPIDDPIGNGVTTVSSIPLDAPLPFNKNLLRKVEELEMSARSAIGCKKAHIEYIGDLVVKTETQMLGIPGFGPRSLNEVKEILSYMNLGLCMTIPEWRPLNIIALAAHHNQQC